MELIIKPTSSCNFACEFCAASNCSIPTYNYPNDRLINLIRKLKPSILIFTGGEPTCVPPRYYEVLLYETKDLDCQVSLTTNLKNIYLYPDEWERLLKHPRFSVGTSFNYGSTRRWDEDTVYTEEKFKEVYSKVSELVDYKIPFIAVIDENNYNRAIDHVYLAKELGTTCKLNGTNSSGRSNRVFPRYKMFKLYLDIIYAGLEHYEENCRDRKNGTCPFNTNLLCENTIRAIYVDFDGNIRWTTCEEDLNRLRGRKLNSFEEFSYIQESPFIRETITDHCYNCELFRLCNGCRINVEQSKEDPDYCKEMSKLKGDIIRVGWKI